MVGSGHFIPALPLAVRLSRGFYQNRTGQSTCVQCPVGSYCHVYYPYYTPIVNPTICPAGSCEGLGEVLHEHLPCLLSDVPISLLILADCPAGTNQPIACPNGYYGNTTGLQTSYCSGPWCVECGSWLHALDCV